MLNPLRSASLAAAAALAGVAAPMPYPIALANGANVLWEGPGIMLLGVAIFGAPASDATITCRDTSGGRTTGGAQIGDVITAEAGAGAATTFAEIGHRSINGLVVTLSAEVAAMAYICGTVAPGQKLTTSDGYLLFGGSANASAVSRVASQALNTSGANFDQGTNAVKVTGDTNAGGPVVTEWGSASVALMAPITPNDLFVALRVDYRLESPGEAYNNGTTGPGANATMQVRFYDAATSNTFNSATRSIAKGEDSVIFVRDDFSTGVGSPSWDSTTFTRVEIRIDAGTSTGATVVWYLDALWLNPTSSNPTPVVFRIDDGWNVRNGLLDLLNRAPALKVSQFAVVNFSDTEKDKYNTFQELAQVQRQFGKKRFGVYWHSVTHTGPTAMEAYTAAVFTSSEITPWITAAFAAGLDTSALYGVTPNGQDSTTIREAFRTSGFKLNGTVRDGMNHPRHVSLNPYDIRVFNMPGSGTLATLWASAKRNLMQGRGCIMNLLFHSIAMENASGTPVSGAAASLNVTNQEIGPIMQDFQALADAWLIDPILFEEIPDRLPSPILEPVAFAR